MKCNNCGFDNARSEKYCINCGKLLNEEMSTNSGKTSNSVAFDDIDLSKIEKKFIQDGDSWDIMMHGSKRSSVLTENNNNTTKEKAVPKSSKKRVSAPIRKQNNSENHTKADDATDQKLADRNLISILLAIVSFLSLIFVFFVISWSDTTSQYTYYASIAANDANDDMYYLTVRGNAGDTAVFRSSSYETTQLEITAKGYVVFNVYKKDLLPIAPIDEEQLEVTPTIAIIKKGTDTPLSIDVNTITISVPEFNIIFEHEQELNQEGQADKTEGQKVIDVNTIECYEGKITISGKVPENTVTIKCDNTEVEIQDNLFSYSTQFVSQGEFQINFEATLPGYRTIKRTFTAIVRDDLSVEQIVFIDDDFQTRVSNGTEELEIYGTVPKGTTLSISTDDADLVLKSEPTVDEEGNFSFVVGLPIASKNYTMLINATLADGSIVSRSFAVQRPPLFNEYIPTLWACHYSDMIKPNYFGVKGFVINGRLIEIISDDDYLYARLTLDDGNDINICYYNHYVGSSVLEEDNTYTMYGYPIRINEDGVLEVFIWFVRD